MAHIHLRCFTCSNDMTFVDSVSRRDECSKCGADVRVCKNCEFYDPKIYNECRETSAEVVREKERANVCDFFRPGDGANAQTKKREDLLAAAEALFKKK